MRMALAKHHTRSGHLLKKKSYLRHYNVPGSVYKRQDVLKRFAYVPSGKKISVFIIPSNNLRRVHDAGRRRLML